jgi:hypothetical protein
VWSSPSLVILTDTWHRFGYMNFRGLHEVFELHTGYFAFSILQSIYFPAIDLCVLSISASDSRIIYRWLGQLFTI